MIYLASPYTHDDPLVMQARFASAARQVIRLIGQGHHVFSPIVHCHALLQFGNLPVEFDFWQAYDENIIKRCDKLLVFTMPGWLESKGVQAEIKFATENGITIEFLEYFNADTASSGS